MANLVERVAMSIATRFEMAHFEAKMFTTNASGMKPNQLNNGVYITDGVVVYQGNVWYHPNSGLEVVAKSFTDLEIRL